MSFCFFFLISRVDSLDLTNKNIQKDPDIVINREQGSSFLICSISSSDSSVSSNLEVKDHCPLNHLKIVKNVTIGQLIVQSTLTYSEEY